MKTNFTGQIELIKAMALSSIESHMKGVQLMLLEFDEDKDDDCLWLKTGGLDSSGVNGIENNHGKIALFNNIPSYTYVAGLNDLCLEDICMIADYLNK